MGRTGRCQQSRVARLVCSVEDMYASESASAPMNSAQQDVFTNNYNVTFGIESSGGGSGGARRLSDPVRTRIWGPPTVRTAGTTVVFV